MTQFSKALADAHIADLHREAARARDRAAARQAGRERAAERIPAVTLRRATSADAPALIRLAALDCTDVPGAPMILAETGGELRAALSLADGRAVADPFHPTAHLVQLLVKCSEHAGGTRSSRLRALRNAFRARSRDRHRSGRPHAMTESS